MKKNSAVSDKLRDRSGESIAETLVALLIAALALVMLAGSITATSRIVIKSRDKLNSYYTANEAMATMTGASDSTLTLSLKKADGTAAGTVTVPVKKVENDVFSDTVASYVIDKSRISSGSGD